VAIPEPSVPDRDEQLRAVTIGELKPLTGRLELREYDPQWPLSFDREAEKIRTALGDRALSVEHVGSTAIPGLSAKPIIDILLVVADSSKEPGYLPSLEAAGYVLRIREPDWHEHRMFKGTQPEVNLHVFSAGCPEIERMLRFRDWLRCNEDDRLLYERTKRELVARDWKFTQHYADAKTAVVEEIMARAGASSST
jgi:GrpB-like predicted nucleotidyltransferase (UPF0157 family)